MFILHTRNYKLLNQFFICIGLVVVLACLFFFSSGFLGYKFVALILLTTVSILAMLFDIYPVLVAAILSALLWNYFFIPPIYTFHISNAEDILMFFLYFVIASVNAVLTFAIRKSEKINRDKEEKEKTIALYNTLVNSLSHELRTPISTIIGAVDTLKENKKKLSETQQDELFTQIQIASVRLNKQVENLLSMSRLESGLLTLHQSWCDLNELIAMVIQKTRNEFPTCSIQFIPNEELPFCKIDTRILEQILQNIISNAILYNKPDTVIIISFDINQQELQLCISDNGQGIPADCIDSIFDKFYRVPNTKTGGTGLGLSIVKGFIEALHGRIEADNLAPHGLSVLIQIPTEISYINNLKNE